MDTTVLLSLVITILWGITPVVIRSMTKTISQHTVMFISAIVYFVATMIFVYTYEYNVVSIDISKHMDILFILVITSFVGFFLTNYMYLYAVKHTDNVNYVVITTSLYPVITLLLSYYFLDEKLTWQGLLGLAFIIIGILLLFAQKST
jgi:drug/metabolite transporter (DMT)-like permease